MKYFSIIMFSARSKLDVKNYGEAIIIKRGFIDNKELDTKQKAATSQLPEILTDEQIEKLRRFFEEAQRPDEKVRREHLVHIQHDD